MKISSIGRINFTIVAVCLMAILFAQMVGLLPDERALTATSRARLCESVTASVSYAVSRHDLRTAGKQLEGFAKQHEDLVSVGLRRFGGDLVVEVGDHRNGWEEALRDKSDGAYVVEIANREASWGQLEFQFAPVYAGANLFFSNSAIKLLCVVALLVGGTCWLLLRRILRYLDPSRAVPPRVRDVLNSFAEGVVVLDEDEHIVVVNDVFAMHVGKTREELIGSELSNLPWRIQDASEPTDADLPSGTTRGSQMQLADADGHITTTFSVNSSPVLDDAGQHKGVMMAFTDVTPLERNRNALISTLEDLSRSKKEITDQNEELRYLATRDPLTSCINRRTFFELFEQHWSNAKKEAIPLCGMMVDIDFFKPINDTYGHSTGDEVLRQTGALLNRMKRADDVVCRYGGEEFAILMPGQNLESAEAAAEAMRIQISEMQFTDFTITASLGLSGFALGADGPQDMLDQADKCLYVAKRNGRNQVVRFDTVPADLIIDESKISRTKPIESEASPSISYAAVTGLFTALSFRDHQTGAHSNRVSNYAALLAQRVMGPKDAFIVEMGALLHDIGKVGVPDAILLKPGKLTNEEWEFMEKHDRIGVEIVNSSFKCKGLTDIVKYHHYRYGGIVCEPQEMWGDEIPIGARILTIVDSFDAMVSDRPYRKGMPIANALAELHRCSGTQFDPELVEHFCQIIDSGCYKGEVTCSQGYTDEVVLCIGEQIERLVEAADCGDGGMFVTLAERLRGTALQNDIESIAGAATHAIDAANEDAQLESLVRESFELLAACRKMRVDPITSFESEQGSVQADDRTSPLKSDRFERTES